MKILLNDIMQFSNAPKELISPSLSETVSLTSANRIIINFDKPRQINCYCIGNLSQTLGGQLLIYLFNGNTQIGLIVPTMNQLLNNKINIMLNPRFSTPNTLSYPITINRVELQMSGATGNIMTIGRLAMGIAINIPTSIAKEPSFNSTSEPRTTLSGQIISGVGGYNYTKVSLDSRYKINEFIMNEIKEGYKTIGMGYPFFIDLSDESYKLPFDRLYATELNQRQLSFESGVRKYLYSRRWEFEEKF